MKRGEWGNNAREIVPRILRDMNDGVLVLDMRGTILYINEQGCKLLGQSQDLIGGKNAAALMSQDVQAKTMPSISLCWTPFTTRTTPTAVRRPTSCRTRRSGNSG